MVFLRLPLKCQVLNCVHIYFYSYAKYSYSLVQCIEYFILPNRFLKEIFGSGFAFSVVILVKVS